MDTTRLFSLAAITMIYGHRLIFKNLDFSFSPGETALVTGPNGAGKSTLLKIIAGLAHPRQGKVERRDNLQIAYLGHATFIYPGLTALENLAFWAKIACINTSNSTLLDTLKTVGLHAHAHDQARFFSRGMAQRLNFARVLLGQPDLFLLDEPFTGLDSASRQFILDRLAICRENGAAILMVSHEPERDLALCPNIIKISGHKLVRGKPGHPGMTPC